MIPLMLLSTSPINKTYIEDVFSAYTFISNGGTQSFTTGIDLLTYGGMVQAKRRDATGNHFSSTTTRGTYSALSSNLTSAPDGSSYIDFGASGFSVINSNSWLVNNATYCAWSWRNAPKFFKEAFITKSPGVSATVDLSTLGTVGMVKVKRTDSAGSWYVWHRSLTAGKLLIGETTAAETTLGHITVSSTTLTLVDGVIADGMYHVEAYAHDTSSDGLIQCGTFTANGSGNATVTLGWELQLLEVKRISSTGDHQIYDEARGFTVDNVAQLALRSNLSLAESAAFSFAKSATGFSVTGVGAGDVLVFKAVRRGPMRLPTSGAQVYNAIARTGTGGAATITGVGFAPDLVIDHSRSHTLVTGFWDRLRGASQFLNAASTGAESAASDAVTSFNMDGFTVGVDTNGYINQAAGPTTYINFLLRRYPGVFDYFPDTGTGANKTETHNLKTIPEFWIRKGRSGATQWVFGSTLLANTEKIVSPSPAGKVADATAWNSTYPTSTAFSVGTAAATNTSTATYITYLIATLAGVSKVFGYTGNGTSQTIPCGFAAGARFVLIVRTDTTGSFYIFDTVRGIVSGNDPHLCLDTSAAEVTTDDSIDPDSSGFIVNQVAATNINVNSATYIGFAIA